MSRNVPKTQDVIVLALPCHDGLGRRGQIEMSGFFAQGHLDAALIEETRDRWYWHAVYNRVAGVEWLRSCGE